MKHIEMMHLAESVALRSVCKRAQVGAALSHPQDGDRYVGWNMRPCGGCCEGWDGRTLPDVTHAEDMAIHGAYTYQDDLNGWTLYVTRQPCIHCARLITAAGIKSVYYRDKDDKDWGLRWLTWHGVEVDGGWIMGRVQESWAEHSWQSGVVSHG